LNAALILCSNPAITYGVFERLKALWLEKLQAKSLNSWQVFLIGAISKSLATILTYPYIMSKTRMQWKPPNNSQLTKQEQELIVYTSPWDVLKKVYSQEGLSGIYKGLLAQILKAVLCQAILFVSKEKLTVYTMELFSAFKKQKVLE
jgi:hypothetical protein